MIFNVALLLLLLIILASSSPFVSASGSVTWDFDPKSPVGPTQWGSMVDPATKTRAFPMCSDGTRQSPIDFSHVGVDPQLRPLEPTWGNVSAASVTNNDHTIVIEPLGTKPQMVDPNTGRSYRLIQFHFHSPSEHTFGTGMRDLEVHLVHQNVIDESDYLVVGVSYVATPVGVNVFFNLIRDALATIANKTGTQVLNRTLMPASILPPSRRYITYPGSLTTPPCTEGVTWYVFMEPVPISVDQLAFLRYAMDNTLSDVTAPLTHGVNGRPVQPVNGRSVRCYDDTIFPYPSVNSGGDVADKVGAASSVAAVALVFAMIAILMGVAALYIVLRRLKKGSPSATYGPRMAAATAGGTDDLNDLNGPRPPVVVT